MGPLDLDIERDGTATVVWLRGDLDIATADRIVTEVGPLVGAAPSGDQQSPSRARTEPPAPREVWIDLRDVDFVDSSGLGALIRVGRMAADAGTTLGLRNVPDQLERLLDITRLRDAFTIS
jgi:anti-anti-sigma regulatory factor